MHDWFPKNQEIKDSSNPFEEESKQLQGETQIGSPNKPSAIIGIIHSIFIIFRHNHCKIESVSSMPEPFAWSSGMNNKINIVELETKQEFANFDGVKLKKPHGIFQLFISDSYIGHNTLRLQLDSRERDCQYRISCFCSSQRIFSKNSL